MNGEASRGGCRKGLRPPLPQPRVLPTGREEMLALGWDELDILLVSGDAYVDHPSFGVALLGRLLLARGFRVGIVDQPPWQDRARALAVLQAMGRPRLFAGITAGAIDSMLAHYTAFRKKRHDDSYTPGGRAGARPNRASIVYTGLVRQAFPALPVVLGGIEASLRRASHYDFWADALRRPLLQDSKADILVYGMGERALTQLAGIAAALVENEAEVRAAPKSGENTPDPAQGRATTAPACAPGETRPGPASFSRSDFVRASRLVPGITWMDDAERARQWLDSQGVSAVELPAHEAILDDGRLLLQSALQLEKQVHLGREYALQRSGERLLVLTPPPPPLSGEEMDELYALPYSRLPHPRHREPIPAWEMIRTSITTHRGCGGGCSFCSLALHQGRRIASRSADSVLAEAGRIARGPGHERPGAGRRHPPAATPRWAGSISDVGGPSANMWRAACSLPADRDCARASCMHPAICPFFVVDQKEGVALLRAVASLPGIRHVRVASGVRFDLALQEPEALYAYTAQFTGGQLKVAPEHSEDAVLRLMRKPRLTVFERFLEAFARATGKAGKELYTVPYLMSAFPGCTEAHMQRLGAWLRRRNWSPRQVQCFIPTPGTVATAMFYCGLDPSGRPIHVARSDKERLAQHHLLLGTGRGRAASPDMA
ncbi:YgiQ family radical SAM protein [Desulfovibrio sp. OttesenSCG-928-A18]|nr:YgiQ family radical SAM protein [Desulfovibrio sp. OttesenSCG-928-A18]